MTNGLDSSNKLAYLQIDEEARSLLRSFRPRVEALIPSVLDEFYAHIVKQEHLAAMFTSEGTMRHAREAQAAHWMRMFSGDFDEEYFASVERIGKAHCGLGLEPGWYIGGYSLVKQKLMQAIIAEAAGAIGSKARLEKAGKLVAAVDKAISLDMDLAISVYLSEKDREFSRRLNGLGDQFSAVIGDISGSLTEASSALATEAEELAGTAESTSSQAATANAGSEEATTNVQAVAAAVEELSASISEISTQVSAAAEVTRGAINGAELMSSSVRGLHEAADKVGGIVRLIEEIAEQTNLLALNATIEAARAGDAGKGFAVVAGEVKHLAQQTANATGEIAGQVKAIQDAVDEVAGQIETISGSIGTVGETSNAIASSIEEQTAVTQEISRSVAEASAGVAAVQGAIGTVTLGATSTQESTGRVREASAGVLGKAKELDVQSREFIERIRNADRRKEPRYKVAARCTLHIGGKAHDLRLGGVEASGADVDIDAGVLDVSTSGAGLRADGGSIAAGVGAVLAVEGHGEAIEAKVVSASKTRIGLSFDAEAGRRLICSLGVAGARQAA